MNIQRIFSGYLVLERVFMNPQWQTKGEMVALKESGISKPMGLSSDNRGVAKGGFERGERTVRIFHPFAG